MVTISLRVWQCVVPVGLFSCSLARMGIAVGASRLSPRYVLHNPQKLRASLLHRGKWKVSRLGVYRSKMLIEYWHEKAQQAWHFLPLANASKWVERRKATAFLNGHAFSISVDFAKHVMEDDGVVRAERIRAAGWKEYIPETSWHWSSLIWNRGYTQNLLFNYFILKGSFEVNLI